MNTGSLAPKKLGSREALGKAVGDEVGEEGGAGPGDHLKDFEQPCVNSRTIRTELAGSCLHF